MKRLIFTFLIAFFAFAILTGCASNKRRTACNTTKTTFVSKLPSMFKITRTAESYFDELNHGLTVKIRQGMPTTDQLCAVDLAPSNMFAGPTISYIRNMGLTEKNSSKDYVLDITFQKVYVDLMSGAVDIDLNFNLMDNNGTSLFKQNVTQTGTNIHLFQGFNENYTLALEQVNWQKIASYLRKPSKDARDEPDAEVRGDGNTSLEQTIVRWDVQSRPQGADLFWRVVSKTPEVKNTNNKYLMTTPYEATKSLDIKGLTYQTAGDVRIILRCEKNGYMPQEKEFNVRMVLDQEEISAFFRLVKEEKEDE